MYIIGPVTATGDFLASNINMQYYALGSDVVLESGSVLESDSSPYFEDSDSDLDSDSNPGPVVELDLLEVFRTWTQHCMTWN